MADPGTPDWWLDRLYKRLRDRQPYIRSYDDWYTGRHPAPAGYEKAGPVLARLLDTVGLNMLAVVTDAPLGRMRIEGFKVGGKASTDIWDIWQANNFDRGSRLVRQEKMALSESYVLVDPNGGNPLLTPEHPEQCIVEYAPGSGNRVAAGLKVWVDELTGPPVVNAMVYLPHDVHLYSARTRVYNDITSPALAGRSALALRPSWELQGSLSGPNPLGEVPLVPFPNRARMMSAPTPEFGRALQPQKRINKTLMDRMSMQDAGAFKAKWATGVEIPEDPETGLPVEPFKVAVDRLFTSEDKDARFGQFEAEDITQMLAGVRDDIADCAMAVPTSADQILGKLVNISGDGLKLAQAGEISRVRERMEEEEESFEIVNRLALKGAGKPVPDAARRMTTIWRNPEYRTDTEQANAAVIAFSAGLPYEAVWERYFNATPDEVAAWKAAQPIALAAAPPVTPPAPPAVPGG